MKRLLLFAFLLLPLLAIPALPAQQKEEVKKLPVQQQKLQSPGSTGYVPLTPAKRAHYQALDRAKNGARIQTAAKNLALPAQFMCSTRSPLPIGDQGQCGSCYLYSTVRTMTDAGVLIGAGKPDGSFALSVQFGMDRPRSFGGCNGGNGTEVIDWAVKNGWIAEKYVDAAGVAHNDYPPYSASSGSDRTAPGAKTWVKGWTWGMVNNNGHPTTDEIKAAMFLHGRLNIALDAGGQFGNGTSTITSLGSSINHEVNLIGWDDAKDGGVFFIENQWGSQWGTNGVRPITYSAAKNIVDHFWVSAGVIPPPVPPVPPTPPGTVIVPRVIGDGLADASAAIKGAGLVVESVSGPLGKVVIAQVPTAGTTAPAGSGVTLTFGDAPLPPIPSNVTITLTAEQVRSIIEQVGTVTITSETTVGQIMEMLKKKAGK